MVDGDFQNRLNEISSNLINMHVSDLFNKINKSNSNNRLRELSVDEKKQIQESVEGLKSQTEAFLADQQNSTNNMQLQTEELIKKLQQIQSNKTNS
ncbi:hypothetical protein GCM10011351_27280 [Paraliobacillus quinghaiensis]|uniref:Uncharacterized protein n=1 Tax=Paraliobacillus quinghaiensis TaxID=470815 RepID=A0A917TVA2_9BACI|nr:hypothetical protein [Paraliobacillus quinghaiensis]GGM39683.1 hypothetical protein GCM10011351_27280 [Paraliobacillus quinghaiensis]